VRLTVREWTSALRYSDDEANRAKCSSVRLDHANGASVGRKLLRTMREIG